MIWKFPEGVKPSLLVAAKALGRPQLESAFLTKKDETTYQLVATNAFIMGRFDIKCEPRGRETPDTIAVPLDALKAIEMRDARAFTLNAVTDWIQPVSLATEGAFPAMYAPGKIPEGGVPDWDKLSDANGATGSSADAFEFGLNADFLNRISRAFGAKQGLRISPGASPLRAIKVRAMQYPEREALIMPIRLNV